MCPCSIADPFDGMRNTVISAHALDKTLNDRSWAIPPGLTANLNGTVWGRCGFRFGQRLTVARSDRITKLFTLIRELYGPVLIDDAGDAWYLIFDPEHCVLSKFPQVSSNYLQNNDQLLKVYCQILAMRSPKWWHPRLGTSVVSTGESVMYT